MKFWLTGEASVKKFTFNPPIDFTSDLALFRSYVG